MNQIKQEISFFCCPCCKEGIPTICPMISEKGFTVYLTKCKKCLMDGNFEQKKCLAYTKENIKKSKFGM